MRLFRKTVAKSKKTESQQQQEKTAIDTQYEYVRKEYGFDYVPPSQYVPSHSISEDEDEEEGVEEDSETIEMQYQGAAPVKIIQPRSELSGSNGDDEGYIIASLPNHSKVYHPEKQDARNNKQPLYTPRRISESHRLRKAPPFIPEEEEEEIIRDRHHFRPRVPKYRDEHIRANEEKYLRPRRYDEYLTDSRHRPMKKPLREVCERQYRDTPPRRSSSYLRSDAVPEDFGGLDIGEVHTAYSYNSDDSADSLVEERFRGSRYSTEEDRKRGHRRPPKTKRVKKQKDQRMLEDQELFLEKELVDQVVVRTGTWRKTRKGWEPEDDKEEHVPERLSRTHRPEEYEKPRYDHTIDFTRKESRNYREIDANAETERRRPRARHSMGYQTYVDEPRDGHEEQPRNRREVYDPDWDSKDIYSRKINQVTTGASYYATPSGAVASDYDASGPVEEPLMPQQKPRSKGFLGRIRDSVRGPSKRELTPFDDAEKDVRFAKAPTVQRDNHRHKPSTLFASLPPSIQSDVSYENRKRDGFLHHKESDVPPTLPRNDAVSHSTRHQSYGPEAGYDANPAHDDYDDDYRDDVADDSEAFHRRHKDHHPRRKPPLEYYEENEYYNFRHPLPPRRGVHQAQYWEVPDVKLSEHPSRREHPVAYRTSSTPFETARKETPVLRANPDHRKSISRHYAANKGHHPNHPKNCRAEQVPVRYAVADEIRYANLASPKLVREHPNARTNIQETLYTAKDGKGLRIGCY